MLFNTTMNTSTIIYNVSIVGSLICAWYYFIAPINLSYILVFYSNHSYNFVPLTVLPCCLLTLCSLHYRVRWCVETPTVIMEVNYYKKLVVRTPRFELGNDGVKVRCLTAWLCPNIFILLLSYILIIAYIHYLVKWFYHFFFNLLFVCKVGNCCCCACVHHKSISFLYSLHTLLLFLLFISIIYYTHN